MIWWILLLFLGGCLDQSNKEILAANHTINHYISFLENYSDKNYTVSWHITYKKDNYTAINATTQVYNKRLIIQNFSNYAFWNYANKTCYRVFDIVGCEEGGFKFMENRYFWTDQYIKKEKDIFQTLLKIAEIKANESSILFIYNYSDLSYADLSALGINPTVVDKISKVILEYQFKKDGMIKHIKKTIYLTNNSTYVLEITYGNITIYKQVPQIKNNTNVDYVKIALSYVINPPEPKRIRAIAIENDMPFLCKLDSNPYVCLDAYITKTENISACKYAPNPEQCYSEYNVTSRS